MPLLARQVRNIIVFVNSSSTYARNDQLQSYFMPLALRDGNGDETMNAVFDPARYLDVLNDFDRTTAKGEGAIACGHNWTVAPNEIYNVRGYTGLNICWVCNYAGDAWKQTLPEVVQSWLAPPDLKAMSRQAKQLRHFPYYATFGENKTNVVKLTPLQINLLADLASWSITSASAVDAVLATFDAGVLPRPASPR